MTSKHTPKLVTLTNEGSHLMLKVISSKFLKKYNGSTNEIVSPVRSARVFVLQDEKFARRAGHIVRGVFASKYCLYNQCYSKVTHNTPANLSP